MKKLSQLEMEKTKGGFLIELFVGLLVGVIIGVIYGYATDGPPPEGHQLPPLN